MERSEPRHERPGPKRRRAAAAIGGIAGLAALAGCLPVGTAAPSTSTLPYVVPTAPGVEIQSVLTVSDSGSAGNGYEMVGLPDALGAYRYGNSVRVLMSHELGATAGITRKHLQRGAFVADLRVDRHHAPSSMVRQRAGLSPAPARNQQPPPTGG